MSKQTNCCYWSLHHRLKKYKERNVMQNGFIIQVVMGFIYYKTLISYWETHKVQIPAGCFLAEEVPLEAELKMLRFCGSDGDGSEEDEGEKVQRRQMIHWGDTDRQQLKHTEDMFTFSTVQLLQKPLSLVQISWDVIINQLFRPKGSQSVAMIIINKLSMCFSQIRLKKKVFLLIKIPLLR